MTGHEATPEPGAVAGPPPLVTPRLRGARAFLLHPEITVLVLILGLGLYLGVSNEFFFSKTNLLDITEAVAVIGIAGAFATLVVIIGGLDLTPVTVFVMSGIVVLKTLEAGWALPLVIIVAIGAGGVIGFVNGFLIARYELNPVIVTLGVNFLFTGLAFVITNSKAKLIDRADFLNLWAYDLPGGIPLVTVVMLGVFLSAFILLRYSRFGIHVYAVGGNIAAARLNGINVVVVQLIVYVLAGLAAGLAGAISVGISGSVAPFGALSQTDLLNIIAAIIIGGTALSGGRGSVWGTLLGVLLFGLIANGLVLKNIATAYQPVIIGAVMLIAVLTERVRRRLAVMR